MGGEASSFFVERTNEGRNTCFRFPDFYQTKVTTTTATTTTTTTVTSIADQTRRQSYRRNFVLIKKSKLVFKYLTVRYLK